MTDLEFKRVLEMAIKYNNVENTSQKLIRCLLLTIDDLNKRVTTLEKERGEREDTRTGTLSLSVTDSPILEDVAVCK